MRNGGWCRHQPPLSHFRLPCPQGGAGFVRGRFGSWSRQAFSEDPQVPGRSIAASAGSCRVPSGYCYPPVSLPVSVSKLKPRRVPGWFPLKPKPRRSPFRPFAKQASRTAFRVSFARRLRSRRTSFRKVGSACASRFFPQIALPLPSTAFILADVGRFRRWQCPGACLSDCGLLTRFRSDRSRPHKQGDRAARVAPAESSCG